MPMKKVAVVQSNYIPWKGYFDLGRQLGRASGPLSVTDWAADRLVRLPLWCPFYSTSSIEIPRAASKSSISTR
jgi:hypothetical protein